MAVSKKKKSDPFDNFARIISSNIKKGSSHFKSAKRLTQIARRVSNRANYLMRKDLFTGRTPSQSKIDKVLKRGVICNEDIALYQKLPAAVSQRTIQIVGDNWSAFAAAKKDWKKNPDKYLGMPKPPKYSNHAKTVYIPCSSFAIKNDTVVFAKKLGLAPLKLKKGMFKDQPKNPKADESKAVLEIRLVPTGSGFKFEIVYDKLNSKWDGNLSNNAQSALFDKQSFISIDLGVSRFATLVSNKADISPILINGGELKRINQWYNKRCAILRSKKKYKHIASVANKRNRKVADKLHKISRYIINLCVMNDIGTVIVGKNAGWKQEVNIGRVNNQNFTNLPHSKFIDILKYKLREFGIQLKTQDESYSSKASYVDNDEIPTYKKDNVRKYVFSGKRVKRGLYKTAKGYLVNADVNGASCIARKAGYNGVSLVTEGCVNQPILIGL
ncbi:RNA-guided endonuclease InsQ/TnpB family protein [Photobacterium damselae]|uniref:RNA-guided endonuclease InsQ/TnpB family protein n=1 Tax=Photobacterium damselae TaxID=38293 RepID=UPI0040683507